MTGTRRGYTLIELLMAISISVTLLLLSLGVMGYLFTDSREASQLLCNISLAQDLAGRFRADVRTARQIRITRDGAEVEFDLGDEKIVYAVRDGMLERHSSTGDFRLGPRVTRVQYTSGPRSETGMLLDARWWCPGSLSRPENPHLSTENYKDAEAAQLASGKSRIWMLVLDTVVSVEQIGEAQRP